MMLDLPFYKNDGDGKQCMQVTMKIVLEHFLDKKYSLEELDKLTGRKNDLWTWTSQAVYVLHGLGLKVEFYSKYDSEPLLQGEPYIREHFGKDAEKILKYTDMPVLMDAVKKTLALGLSKIKVLPFNKIEEHLSKGHVPLMLVDHNIIVGREGLFGGHFVVVTGFDDENVYYHESGPEGAEPNKKVKKETFIKAWNANGTDNDVVIVYGKR